MKLLGKTVEGLLLSVKFGSTPLAAEKQPDERELVMGSGSMTASVEAPEPSEEAEEVASNEAPLQSAVTELPAEQELALDRPPLSLHIVAVAVVVKKLQAVAVADR